MTSKKTYALDTDLDMPGKKYSTIEFKERGYSFRRKVDNEPRSPKRDMSQDEIQKLKKNVEKKGVYFDPYLEHGEIEFKATEDEINDFRNALKNEVLKKKDVIQKELSKKKTEDISGMFEVELKKKSGRGSIVYNKFLYKNVKNENLIYLLNAHQYIREAVINIVPLKYGMKVENGRSLEFFKTLGSEAGLTFIKQSDLNGLLELHFQFKPIDKDEIADSIKSANIMPDAENITSYIEDFIGFTMLLRKIAPVSDNNNDDEEEMETLYTLYDCYLFVK